MSEGPRSSRHRAKRFVAGLGGFFGEPRGFLWGAATNLVTTTIAYLVSPYAQLANLMIIHLLGAVLISTRYGFVVSTFTAITGALAFDYFCIPPIFAFALPDTHSVIVFVGMTIVALSVCWLNQRLRQERALARKSESRTRALCELSLELSEVNRPEAVLIVAERHLCRLFGPETRVLVEAEGVRVACEAGATAEQRVLLTACADRIAQAMARIALSEQAQRAQFETEAERLRNALLSAVSHDLKTPLASILTAGTTLLGRLPAADDEERQLLETVVQETERMNSLVTNLLSVTRLESGNVRLNKTPEALEDLIYGVLSRFSTRLERRDVEVDIAAELPLVPLDAALLDQVLVNLIDNALRYTPPGSPLAIRAAPGEAEVVLEICDRGPGIAADERERVFEKFYRGRRSRPSDGGTGLGLTICRAVAHAHGGRIAIGAREGGGTRIELCLPCPAAKSFDSNPPLRRLAHA